MPLVTSLQPMQGVNPPQTVEEAAQGKQGWLDFLQKARTDPDVQNAMLNFGAQMMQPIVPGKQTLGGQFGQALMGSMAALQKSRSGKEAKAMKERKQTEAEKAGTSKRKLEGAQAEYYGRMPNQSGGRKTATEAMTDKLTDAYMTQFGWDAKDPKKHAIAYQMAVAQIRKGETEAAKQRAKLAADVLPGQEAQAEAALTQQVQQDQPLELLRTINPAAYEEVLRQRQQAPITGMDFQIPGAPGSATLVPPVPAEAAAWMPMPEGRTLSDGIHTDTHGNRIEVRGTAYRILPPSQ